jgi:hypothetical protein
MTRAVKSIIHLTAIDDMRLVREKIAREYGGDISEHVADSRRLAKDLRKKFGLKTVSMPLKRRRAAGER